MPFLVFTNSLPGRLLPGRLEIHFHLKQDWAGRIRRIFYTAKFCASQKRKKSGLSMAAVFWSLQRLNRSGLHITVHRTADPVIGDRQEALEEIRSKGKLQEIFESCVLCLYLPEMIYHCK